MIARSQRLDTFDSAGRLPDFVVHWNTSVPTQREWPSTGGQLAGGAAGWENGKKALAEIEEILQFSDPELPSVSAYTVELAMSFIRLQLALASAERLGFVRPDVTPGPKGSIDLHWRSKTRELLVNVKPSGIVGYYGDGSDTVVKGRTPLGPKRQLLPWMTAQP